jgi:hypothetical protein
VVQLLSQMSNQLAALSRTVDRSGEQVKALYEQGRKAPRQDARAGLEPRPGRPAQRRLRHRGDGSARDHRFAAADLGRFRRPADRRRSRRGLHRAGRRRPQRRSRGAPDRRGDPGSRRRSRRNRRRSRWPPARLSPTNRQSPRASCRSQSAEAVLRLRRRFHPKLGRRHLDRSHAGGAGPLSCAWRMPASAVRPRRRRR